MGPDVRRDDIRCLFSFNADLTGPRPAVICCVTARRVTMSQRGDLAVSGKSGRSFCTSRLVEEGRFGRSSRYVECGMRWTLRRQARLRKTTGDATDGEVVRS